VPMNDLELGRRFRALRHRLGWRQSDVGAKAGVSQDVVSLVERGRIADVSIRALRRHAEALDAELQLSLWFRAGELDRLVDEGHSAIVGAVTRRLGELGWEVRPEVSFAVYGERGSIDVVAWHAASRVLLVIEVKTELTSVEETLRRHDVKVRLAAGIVRERFGWQPLKVARLLVLPSDTTRRRQARRHDGVLRTTYPLRGVRLRRWLAAPVGSVGGLLFVADTSDGRAVSKAVARKRIHRRKTVPAEAAGRPPEGSDGASTATHDPASSKAGPAPADPALHDEGS
jgi:transcriptional regulator with XRE-family HTH domain